MEKHIDYEFKARPIAVNTLSMYAVVACFICPFLFIGMLSSSLGGIIYFVFIILELLFLAAVSVLKSVRSTVNANKNNLTVRNFVCGNVVSVKKYEYSDIEAADCFVSQNISRNRVNVSYSMQAIIMLKNGKALHYIMDLKIELNLHKHDPKLYNKLVENEEMLKLCTFINEIKAKQNSDGNMR